jgi:hypothetical protein
MPNKWDEPPDEIEEEIGPDDPDYDLSEAHGYTWEQEREHSPVPRWLIVGVSLVAAASLLLPSIFLLLRYG